MFWLSCGPSFPDRIPSRSLLCDASHIRYTAFSSYTTKLLRPWFDLSRVIKVSSDPVSPLRFRRHTRPCTFAQTIDPPNVWLKRAQEQGQSLRSYALPQDRIDNERAFVENVCPVIARTPEMSARLSRPNKHRTIGRRCLILMAASYGSLHANRGIETPSLPSRPWCWRPLHLLSSALLIYRYRPLDVLLMYLNRYCSK
jgi:hypothetical protein